MLAPGSLKTKGPTMHLPRTRLLSGLVLFAVVALLAAGCGGSKKSSSGGSTNGGTTTTSTTASPAANVSTDKKIAAEVPAKDKSKTLIVAADASYAPNEFIGSNGKTVVGWDPELTQALAKVMGVKAKVVNATFATIIPGLQSGKYDLGMSSFSDTKEREKVVDFVTYFTAGTSFYVKAQGGPTINSLADLCGHSVAVETGTTQLDDATAQNKKCKAAGKAGVTVKGFPDQNAANLALSSGREQVGMADSPVAAYIVKQSNGKFKLSGKSYNNAPYGIAIPKGNGMAKPIQAALKELISNGTYVNILKKWGVQAGAIKNPQINAAVS
jgi:polar amino acid transport system substrate-binding protein